MKPSTFWMRTKRNRHNNSILLLNTQVENEYRGTGMDEWTNGEREKKGNFAFDESQNKNRDLICTS